MFFEINSKGSWKLKASERELPLLQGLGVQNCICFSGDGSLLATGGKVLLVPLSDHVDIISVDWITMHQEEPFALTRV